MNRLKELRQEKKLTQKELADLIDVHYRTLQNWENGESQIKPDKAQQLADFFGVSVGYLLGYDSDSKKQIKTQLLNDIIKGLSAVHVILKEDDSAFYRGYKAALDFTILHLKTMKETIEGEYE